MTHRHTISLQNLIMTILIIVNVDFVIFLVRRRTITQSQMYICSWMLLGQLLQ